MRSSARRSRGHSVPELLIALAILGALWLVSAPAVGTLFNEMSLRAASGEVATVMTWARNHAVLTGQMTGLKWLGLSGDVVFSVYEDGNGDGVRNADIRSGVDRLILGPISLKGRYPRVSFAFLPGFVFLDPSGNPVGDLSDPIRFGTSDICSFSPLGHSSPGSVYLSDGRDRQNLVRLSPATSRIQVYEWVAARKTWRPAP